MQEGGKRQVVCVLAPDVQKTQFACLQNGEGAGEGVGVGGL